MAQAEKIDNSSWISNVAPDVRLTLTQEEANYLRDRLGEPRRDVCGDFDENTAESMYRASIFNALTPVTGYHIR